MDMCDSVGHGSGRRGDGSRVLDVNWPVLLRVTSVAVLWTLNVDSLLAFTRVVPLGFGANLVAGNEGMLKLDVLLL
jgi:predicted nucleotidyltransferase